MDMQKMTASLQDWTAALTVLEAVPAADLRDGRTGLVIVDMVNGFLTEGVLSSPRSASVLPAVVRLAQFAKEGGLPTLAFRDCHEPDCIEFETFPPHCVRGTTEAQLAPELAAIGGFTVVDKNSTNGALTQGFCDWLDSRPELARLVVCGVCTDICVMQFCQTAKKRCDQLDRPIEILVPIDTVETYDAPGHDADLCGAMALQLMQQAGITLKKEVAYDAR